MPSAAGMCDDGRAARGGGPVVRGAARHVRGAARLDRELAATALFDAVDAGDLDGIRRALAQGSRLNAQDSTGMTPLARAAREGRAEVVRLLLSKGAEVDRPSSVFGPPLIRAAANGHVDVVDQLLRAGASPRSRDRIGGTALWYAAGSDGDVGLIERLVAAGADLEARDRWGTTPLMEATAAGNVDAVRACCDSAPTPVRPGRLSNGESRPSATGQTSARPARWCVS